jgi:hypothetical protein
MANRGWEVRMCAVGKQNLVVYVHHEAKDFDTYPSTSRDEVDYYTYVKHPGWFCRTFFKSTFQDRVVNAVNAANQHLTDRTDDSKKKLRDELLFAYREGNLQWMKAIGKK